VIGSDLCLERVQDQDQFEHIGPISNEGPYGLILREEISPPPNFEPLNILDDINKELKDL